MKYIISFLASLCAFFIPVQGLLIAVGVAISLDTFTGISKSVKLEGWESINSRRLSDVVAKMLLYNTVVLFFYLIDYFLLSEFMKIWFSIDLFFTKLCTLILVIIELVSIKENFEGFLGINLWAMLKNALRRSQEIKNDFNELTK